VCWKMQKEGEKEDLFLELLDALISYLYNRDGSFNNYILKRTYNFILSYILS